MTATDHDLVVSALALIAAGVLMFVVAYRAMGDGK